MKPIQRFMRVFFYLLYHPFAFVYDFVASFVSFGQWKNWGRSILPFINGTHILELGHGPGHLQRTFLAQPPAGNLKIDSVAIDESAQMGKLAKRRLGNVHKLTRGVAQHLPFQNNSFDTVVSTFPTDYIFSLQTLSEVKRVLRNSGRLIVLPVVLPKSGFLKWLYKVTRESPEALDEVIKHRFEQPFIQAGFQTEIKVIEVKSSQLLIVLARKGDPSKFIKN